MLTLIHRAYLSLAMAAILTGGAYAQNNDQILEWAKMHGVSGTLSNQNLSGVSGALGESYAVSDNVMPAEMDGYVEFTVNNLAAQMVFGLSVFNENVKEDKVKDAIAFGMAQNGNLLEIKENGVDMGVSLNCVLGTVVRVAKNGDYIRYFVDGVEQRSVYAEPTEMRLQVSLLNSQASIGNIRLSFKEEVKATATVTHPNEYQSGSVQISITGGYPPYKVKWEHTDEVATFLGELKPGDYNAYIEDSEGQTTEVGFVVKPAWIWQMTDGSLRSAKSLKAGYDGSLAFSWNNTMDFAAGIVKPGMPATVSNFEACVIFKAGAAYFAQKGKILAKLGIKNKNLKLAKNGSALEIYNDGNKVFTTAIDGNEAWDFGLDGIQADLGPNDLQEVAIAMDEELELHCEFTEDSPDETLIWSQTTLYDGLGDSECNKTITKRVYTDALGNVLQTQLKDHDNWMVWANQPLYDHAGLAVGGTLSAPTGSDHIVYKPDFARNTNGQVYGPDDFDARPAEQAPQFPSLGDKTLSPNPISPTSPLGWYYSTQNTLKPDQAVTNFPYSRTEISRITGAPRMSATAGDAYAFQGTREAKSYAFEMVCNGKHELYALLGYADPFELVLKYDGDSDGFSDYTGQPVAAISRQPRPFPYIVKTVATDVDGKQAVAFHDPEGNLVARALVDEQGNRVSTQTQPVEYPVEPVGGFIDLHVAHDNTNVQLIGGTINVDIYSLLTDQAVHLAHTSSSVVLAKGFYRLYNNHETTNLVVKYSLPYHNFTLNFYNTAGDLVATVPPNGIHKNFSPIAGATPNRPALKEMSLFRYDNAGRIQWSKTPDAGLTKTVYNALGQPRYSQDAKQRDANECTFVNYDKFYRTVATGVLKGAAGGPDVMAGASPQANVASTASNSKEVTETFYDAAPTPAAGFAQNFTQNRVAYVRNAESQYWVSYDEYGRMRAGLTELAGMGSRKSSSIEYDAWGKVKSVTYQDGQTDRFKMHYTTTRKGELLKIQTEKGAINTTPPLKTIATFGYNIDGTLRTKGLADGAQHLHYTYTLHGQLKGINALALRQHNDPANRLFAMELTYYEGDYASRNSTQHWATGVSNMFVSSNRQIDGSLTGKVAKQEWRYNDQASASPLEGQFAYYYEYNHRGELREAEFGKLEYAGGFGMAHVYGTTLDGRYKEHGMEYDENGNIMRMKRNGAELDPINGMAKLIDDVTYQMYQGTNRLARITDLYDDANPKDLKSQPDLQNYRHNAIGELVVDMEKDEAYQYNAAGQITQVTKRSTGQPMISYFYGPGGKKVRKEVYLWSQMQSVNGQGTVVPVKVEFYLGGMIYQGSKTYQVDVVQNYAVSGGSGVSSIVRTEITVAGRAATIHEASTGDVYIYHISDHLGNTRVSFSVNASHTLSVESYTDYYASGWEMPGRTYTSANRTRFGYQGAFTENDADLGMTTFDLRAYDARLMRWHNPDPYDQYHSPYVAMGNDWVNGVDADGGFYQELWNWIKSGFKKEGWISNEAKAFMESHPGSEYEWHGNLVSGYGFVDKYNFSEDGSNYIGGKRFAAVNDAGFMVKMFDGNWNLSKAVNTINSLLYSAGTYVTSKDYLLRYLGKGYKGQVYNSKGNLINMADSKKFAGKGNSRAAAIERTKGVNSSTGNTLFKLGAAVTVADLTYKVVTDQATTWDYGKAGADITFGYISTMGPIGAGVGLVYFGVDALVGWDNIISGNVGLPTNPQKMDWMMEKGTAPPRPDNFGLRR